MSVTLLIDGDVIAYQIAAAAEVATDWGDDFWTLHADAAEAKQTLDAWILNITQVLSGTRLIVALTDKQNFRKDILPSYKANRIGTRKPLILAALKDHLRQTTEVFERPGLEADDCLGILATMGDNKLIKGDRVIVSIDKDFKQIPGKTYNPSHPELGVQEITKQKADFWHLYQTLIGDATDGYKGCPGVGPVKATKALANLVGKAAWDAIEEAFKDAGFGPEEALIQARVARILRAEDYNFTTKEPILWTPPTV